MSIASPSSTDFTTCITTIRGYLASGAHPTADELRLILAVLKDAVARQTASNSLGTAVTAQLVILQAKGTNDASAEIDTADTTLAALVTALSTTPTYVTSTVADG